MRTKADMTINAVFTMLALVIIVELLHHHGFKWWESVILVTALEVAITSWKWPPSKTHE